MPDRPPVQVVCKKPDAVAFNKISRQSYLYQGSTDKTKAKPRLRRSLARVSKPVSRVPRKKAPQGCLRAVFKEYQGFPGRAGNPDGSN
ncbi:MAG: hypothetical protein AB1374_09895, partial [Bacillota bacterium]